jgi:Ca2+/H+ antiporter, TMEM165/GDT1 family
LAYGAVFVAAAVPWLEVLLVIPPAVAAGLDPVAVAILAFLGNVIPVVAIVAGYDAFRRRRARGGAPPSGRRSRRRERAQRLMARYGVPGLAVAGPLVTGVHLATVLAVALRAPRARVVGWMSASLLAWTVVITALSVAGAAALLPGR